MDQPGAGEHRQRPQVDMALGARIVAGNIAGDHAGIGRVDVTRDQAQPHARFGLHAEAPQHRDMGVAAADQHDVGGDGYVGPVHTGRVTGVGSYGPVHRAVPFAEIGNWRKRVGVEPTRHV